MSYLFLFLLFFTGVFLILIILIQRGKGGGLAGAFGGLGGQSAFGAKAGDTFTRITIGVAAFWIVLCVLSVRLLGTGTSRLTLEGPMPAPKSASPATPGTKSTPAGSADAPAQPSRGGTQPSAPPAGKQDTRK